MLYNDAQVDLIVYHLRRFSVKSQPLPPWLLLFSYGIYVGNCEGCCENLIVRHIQQLYQVCCVVIQWAGICPEWAIHTKHRCVFSCKSSWNDTILWGLATLLWCIFQLSAKQRIWLHSTNIWQVLSSGNTAMWCLWCDNVKPLMQRK